MFLDLSTYLFFFFFSLVSPFNNLRPDTNFARLRRILIPRLFDVSSFRRQEDQNRSRSGESLLGGDGRGEGLRLRGRETVELEETKNRDPTGHREAHVLQVFKELHSRVAPEETHQVRVRSGAEGPVSLLCGEDEATRPRVQTHPSVPSRSKRLRDRSELTDSWTNANRFDARSTCSCEETARKREREPGQ